VTKNKKPWFIVEAKNSKHKEASDGLIIIKRSLNVPHAF
jgi:hypothetical protein